MKKFLVLSYHNGDLNVDVIKGTYNEAKDWMDSDVMNYVSTFNLKTPVEALPDDQVFIGGRYAFANPDGRSCCDWKIVEIDV